MKLLPIDRVLADARLLGAELAPLETWAVWLVALRAAFGLPLDDVERKVFAAIAGSRAVPTERVRELWCVVGRRGGKSRMSAAIAVYLALFQKHRVVAGERPMVLVLAASMEQAKVVFGYVQAFLQGSAALAREVVGATQTEVRLKNGVAIAVHANSFRSVRGRTLAACVFDEVAFWRDDTTATPDTEVYTAVLPSLVTTDGMLVGISSPYRRAGLLHAKHKRHFGVDGDTLVVQGSSKTFNPTLPEAAVLAAREADPTASASEWDAVFRDDLVGLFDDLLVDGAVDRSRPLELPPRLGLFYRAFTDASGGALGGDAYALAIAHKEDGKVVVDVVRGRGPPFDPKAVTEEYAKLCKDYRIGTVVGDRYGAEWVASAWREAGLTYVPSELTASELYLELVPRFTRRQVSLPDHPVLLRELKLLERSPTRMGRDQVFHPRGTHDDCAVVVAGCLHALSASTYDTNFAAWIGGGEPEEIETYAQAEARRRQEYLMQKFGQPVALAGLLPH